MGTTCLLTFDGQHPANSLVKYGEYSIYIKLCFWLSSQLIQISGSCFLLKQKANKCWSNYIFCYSTIGVWKSTKTPVRWKPAHRNRTKSDPKFDPWPNANRLPLLVFFRSHLFLCSCHRIQHRLTCSEPREPKFWTVQQPAFVEHIYNHLAIDWCLYTEL